MPRVRASATVAAAAVAAIAATTLFACGEQPPPGVDGPVSDAATSETARAAAARFFRPDKDRIPHELATNPGEPWGDYLGSKACAECHAKDHADWRQSFHSRTLYDVAPKTVFGDFSGDVVFSDARYGFTVRPFKQGGKFWMDIQVHAAWKALYANPATRWKLDNYYGKDPESSIQPPYPATGHWEVIYAFGNRRHQPYVVRDAKGRYWVPPVYWNDVTRTWQYDGWRAYTVSCAPCHVTGVKSVATQIGDGLGFEMTSPLRWTPPSSEEGWAEGAVGCETCHGPGRAHVAKVRELGTEAYREYVKTGARTIYCPSDDTPEMRMKQCDSCHNFKSEYTVTWVPGPKGYDHPMARREITASGPNASPPQFWKDGTHMSPCTVGRVFRDSKMGKAGVECRDCHDSHGNSSFGSLVRPLADNALCLGCHEHSDRFGTKEKLEAHTHHAAGSSGSSCVECHMPRDKHFTNGVQVMAAELHSHAMSIPTGDTIAPPDSPRPSCNTCHTDRDVLWTRSVLERWFPKKR